MKRTDAQRSADNALDQAIRDVIQAYCWEEEGILTDFLVIVAQAKLSEDEESITNYNLVFPNGTLPLHTAIGLASVAKDLMMSGIMIKGNVDDDDSD